MKTHLNTLFVTLEGAYLKKDGEAVAVKLKGETKLRVPLHSITDVAFYKEPPVITASKSQKKRHKSKSQSTLSPTVSPPQGAPARSTPSEGSREMPPSPTGPSLTK